MGKRISEYSQVLKLLLELKGLYPSYSLGQHISTAFSEYGDLWGISDKEFLFALQKYKTEMEFNIVSDDEVDKIMKDAQNLDTLFKEEEEDYE